VEAHRVVESLRLPHFLEYRLTDGGEVVSLTRKAIPVTARGGPYGCESLRLPHFLNNRLTDGGEVVSLTRKAIPVTARGGPYGCESLRLPHFLDNRLTDGGVCQPYMPEILYPHEDSWYSFLLEAESTPGPSATGRVRSIEKKI
jgi:hypothetical protein